MVFRKSIFRTAFVLLIILMMSASASAQPLNAVLGTGFTYQGKLTDGGTPASGLYDLEFKLYNVLSGGSPLGGAVTRGDVSVSKGLFTVQLDFGSVFDGTAFYLEIGVRPGASVGAYTTLVPRQPLSAAPYAIYAASAASAPWSGLSGVPAGFADGIDNGSAYQNVRVVAKSGGDFSTITAALNSITDASAANRYLVWVAPGVYTEAVTMKSFVDIEGAGELVTKITFTGDVSPYSGTLKGASSAELRFLTVENTGDAASYGIAIFNFGAAPRLTHVTASAAGGSYVNQGVYNYSSSPTMTDVTASASGGSYSYAVDNDNSSPVMSNVTVNASGGGNYSIGVHNSFSSTPTMKNVTANASGGPVNIGVDNNNSSPTMINTIASASGGGFGFGVRNINATPTMTDVIASASSGTDSYGVFNSFSAPTMTNVTASAWGGMNNYGVWCDASTTIINNSIIRGNSSANSYGIYETDTWGDYKMSVNNSQIYGAINTIRNGAYYTTRVGASHLDGGPAAGSGFLVCAGVYDDTYAFYASTCP